MCGKPLHAGIQLQLPAPGGARLPDDRFFSRLLAGGTLGFGESYMAGWWDCEALDEMCCRAIAALLEERFTYSLHNLAASDDSMAGSNRPLGMSRLPS